MDVHLSRVIFDDFKVDSDDEDSLHGRLVYLEKLFEEVYLNRSNCYAGTDASLPKGGKYQAVPATLLFRARTKVFRTRSVAGNVTAPDAELFAICSAIAKAISFDWCRGIVIFTDSMASARRAVDPSIHSGQGHSVAICVALASWFEADPRRRISFVYVPSKLEWGTHAEAQEYAKELKVPMGRN